MYLPGWTVLCNVPSRKNLPSSSVTVAAPPLPWKTTRAPATGLPSKRTCPLTVGPTTLEQPGRTRMMLTKKTRSATSRMREPFRNTAEELPESGDSGRELKKEQRASALIRHGDGFAAIGRDQGEEGANVNAIADRPCAGVAEDKIR